MTPGWRRVPARWRRRRAPGATRPVPICRSWRAVSRRSSAAIMPAAIDALAPLAGENERIGGSRAQHDLIEFTLLKAYLDAGRLEEARQLLAARRPGASGVPVAGVDRGALSGVPLRRAQTGDLMGWPECRPPERGGTTVRRRPARPSDPVLLTRQHLVWRSQRASRIRQINVPTGSRAPIRSRRAMKLFDGLIAATAGVRTRPPGHARGRRFCRRRH